MRERITPVVLNLTLFMVGFHAGFAILEAGFQVLVVANAPAPGFVADTGAELGFPVLGACPTVPRH